MENLDFPILTPLSSRWVSFASRGVQVEATWSKRSYRGACSSCGALLVAVWRVVRVSELDVGSCLERSGAQAIQMHGKVNKYLGPGVLLGLSAAATTPFPAEGPRTK